MSNAGIPRRTGLWGRFTGLLHERFIRPFLDSRDPVPEVAIGASVGIFLGLTPTVGIQMYTVFLLWILFRYVLRIRFNMVVGMAMVWISNPLTMIPMYYAFLVTGHWFQEIAGMRYISISYAAFHKEVVRLSNSGNGDGLVWLYHAAKMLMVEFGWPMVVGSLAYAIPGTIAAYPVTTVLLHRFRRLQAVREGVSYEEWQARHVRSGLSAAPPEQ